MVLKTRPDQTCILICRTLLDCTVYYHGHMSPQRLLLNGSGAKHCPQQRDILYVRVVLAQKNVL